MSEYSVIMQSEYRRDPVTDELEGFADTIPLSVSSVQNASACPKNFGITNISGNSKVILGDVYISSGILQVECKHVRVHQSTKLSGDFQPKFVNLGGSIVRTKSRCHVSKQLISCITLARKTITRADIRYNESSWFIAINVLQRCLFTFGLTYHLSGLTFLRPRVQCIVPDDAPFMLACRRGDMITMRSLISEGQAAYSDITKDNLSPLYFALENGDAAAIEEVLKNCTDIDATFGSNQTSALVWALYHRNITAVRLILARDADLERISLLGWTPVFYLWRDQTELQDSSLELLQILRTSDPRGFRRSLAGIIDVGEMSLPQRVASLGTPDELQWLLDCGADAHSRTGQLEWTASFHAAYDGKLENLRVLGHTTLESLIQSRDLRGWSLLHVAAAEGRTNVIEWLLESGADPFAKSRPSFVGVSEALYGRECTPAEVARSESVEKEQAYLTAVKKICGDQCLSRDRTLENLLLC